ncbi:MAG: ABC transporter permease [Clostridiales bacterium]|jgi:hypothetical protein|nr:ABC transporter permease [Clostridiales bacterium]
MFIFNAALKIITEKWLRIVLFIAASIALTVSFALVGQGLLYGDKITDPLSVIIVDRDNSAESRMFTQMFMEYDLYKNILNFSTNGENNARQLIKENKATAVIIFPRNFAENIKNGKNEPFTVILNDAQPLKKTLTEYFALSFAEILAGSQAGVYAALDYTYQNSPENYERMFSVVNFKFLNLVLNRNSMLNVSQVSAVSRIPVFLHYLAAFWIFINLAGISLFIDVINSNFNTFTLKKLRLAGANIFLTVSGLVAGFFAAFTCINAAFLIPVLFLTELPKFSFALILNTALFFLCVSCLAVFISLMFKNPAAASVTTSVFSLAGLFLSGGIIPREFFAPVLRNSSYATLNYWLYEAVTGAFTNSGAFAAGVVFLITALLFFLSVIRVYKLSY